MKRASKSSAASVTRSRWARPWFVSRLTPPETTIEKGPRRSLRKRWRSAGGTATAAVRRRRFTRSQMWHLPRGATTRHSQMMEESARLAGEIGFSWWQVGALSHLAEYALELGRIDAARQIRPRGPDACPVDQ